MTAKTFSTTAQDASQELGQLTAQIRRSLEAPISALQASIEDLERDFPENDARGTRLGHAIELIEALRQNVHALVDLAAPDAATPLSCTLEELARAALRQAPARIRSGVELACEDADRSLSLDGPMASRGLSYLIQAHVAPEAEALLRLSCNDGEACFTLVLSPRDGDHSRIDLCDAHTSNRGAELLSLAAEHELNRLGGTVDSTLATSGATKVSVRLPLENRVGGGL